MQDESALLREAHVTAGFGIPLPC